MLKILRNLSYLFTAIALATGSANAQSLPSGAYDDYDLEKYQKIYESADYNYRIATQQLQAAESALSQAQAHEANLQRQLHQITTDLQNQRAREIEINNALQQTQQAKTHLAREIERDTRELTQLQNNLTQAQQSLARVQQMAAGLKAELDAATAAMNQLKNVLAQKQQALTQAQNALNQQNKVIEQVTRELNAAPADKKAEIQKRLDAELAKLPALMTAKSAAEAEVAAAQNAVSAKQPEFDKVSQRHAAAQTELTAAQQRVNEAQRQVTAKQGEINQNQQRLAEAQRREQQLTQNLHETRRRVQDLTNQAYHVDNQLRQAIAARTQRQYERDQALTMYSIRSNERQQASNRLAQVQSYIESARQAIQALANQQGGADGDREARELGTARGMADGNREGNAAGTEQGQQAGRERDYNDGMNKGLAAAEAEALNPRPINTAPQGVAYNTGKERGYEFGYRTRNNKAAYAKGRAAGEAQGLQDAIDEAKPMEPIGYSDREQTYLNAPLKKVTLGEASISSGFQGTQGRMSGPGEDKYYNPRPGNYPHPRLTQFYMSAYDSSYRSTLERIYAEVYAQVKADYYERARSAAEAREYAKDYPASRDLGFNQAYLGFTHGNAQGSQQVGYDEGQKFAHDANIEIEKDKAYKAGVARADALYTKNAVLKVVGIDVVDNDRDGVIRPGETLQAIYVIKNFGLVAKTDLAVEAYVTGGSASVVEARAISPSIPPQSEATVYGRQQILVSQNATDGAAIAFAYRLVDSKEIARQTFNRTANFPVITRIADFDGVIIPNEQTQVKISLTNRSKSPQSLTVQMNVDAEKVILSQPQISVDRLNPGESKTVTFIMSGRPEARFEESTISATVAQNNLLFGQTQQQVTIIKRHQATADSLGLIISRNLAKGGGKALYSLAQLDTWDLRVDGSISTQLSNYAQKTIHLMADAGEGMDANSARSIISHVTNGGQLVIWGAQLDQSAMLGQLSSINFAKVSRASNINDTLVGEQSLAGINHSYSGAAAPVDVNGLKGRTVLYGKVSYHGVQSFMTGYVRNQKVGRVYTLGLDSTRINADFFNQLHSLISSMSLSFDQKLENTIKDPSWMNLLVLDMLEEVYYSENENKDFYDDHEKNNKLFKALERMIKKDVPGHIRDQFAREYKTIHDAAKALGVYNYLYRVTDLTTAGGFFGKTWKSLFCDVDKNSWQSEYCKNDNNNGG